MKKGLLAAFLVLFAAQAHASLDALIENVKQNNLAEVQKLLANGENVNAANEQGNTALHYAVALDNAEIVKALLAKGADLKAENDKGWTPLLIAEKKEVPNVAPILREAVEKSTSKVVEQTSNRADEKAIAAAEKVIAAAEQAKAAAEQAKVAAEQTSEATEQTAETIEQTISQTEIAEYKSLVERAKQEIITAREERNAVEAKNKELEQEIKRLKDEAAKTPAQAKSATQETVKKADTKPVAKPVAKAPAKPVAKALAKPVAKAQPKPLADHSRPSKLIPQINTENEAVVYCLNYLGQGENKNMVAAAGHYAASVGIKQARYDRIVELSNNFFASSDAMALKTRSDECGKVITPADATRQNMIIRSLNYAIGY